MIRTKPAPPLPEHLKAKNQTKDGRLLGKPFANMIPKKFQNVIPEAPSYSDPSYSKKDRASRQAHAISRTLAPLAMQPDDDIAFNGKKYRIRGINQAKFNILVSCYQSGMTKTRACQLAGISIFTFNDWLKKGEDGMYPYVYITLAIREAEAALEKQLLDAIIAGGTMKEQYEESVEEYSMDAEGKTTEKAKISKKVKHPQWQSAAWLLERRNPAYRLDQVEQPATTTNTGDEDLLMMDGTSLGLVQEFQPTKDHNDEK